jgi:hypothetical protein
LIQRHGRRLRDARQTRHRADGGSAARDAKQLTTIELGFQHDSDLLN